MHTTFGRFEVCNREYTLHTSVSQNVLRFVTTAFFRTELAKQQLNVSLEMLHNIIFA